MTNPADSLLIASSSARAIAGLYSVSLVATLVLAVVASIGWFTRRAGAEVRALVWRSAVVGLLVVFIGRQLPLHWVAWVVPQLLATPLVALGRVQVIAPSPQSHAIGLDSVGVPGFATVVLVALLVVYVVGVLSCLLPTLRASVDARRRLRSARAVDAAWTQLVEDARRTLGIRRHVRAFVSDDVPVAMTWGMLRPVIVIPTALEEWSEAQRRMVLLHELAHVRAADWIFGLAARAAGALFWFHPGVWWVTRQLHEACEQACDERVIAAGAKRSDYAELLVCAAELLPSAQPTPGAALALSRRRGLRARLAAVIDRRHEPIPLASGSAAAALALTIALAGPVSVVQLAPTRTVLTTLMRDAQWESRAYAVLGLAQRPDSVAVAVSAAELDPSPRVRAWAQYALGRRGTIDELRAIIRER